MMEEIWEKYQRLKTYQVDPERSSTLDEFYDEISSVIIPDTDWGHNIHAFNDMLRGGFGAPDEVSSFSGRIHRLM
ncbi:MAG: hypothetical protein AAGK38_01270 [Pseudomonadota bacterium]